jgi:hypothetical protein
MRCAVVALLERHITDANAPGIGIEGAYFNRSVGGAHSILSYSGNWFVPFKPLDPYLWIGAAAVCPFTAAAFALLARMATRHP